MRRIVLGLTLLALSACAQTRPDSAVFFNDFSADLDPVALDIVKGAADAANRSPNTVVKVTGYADSVGSPKAEIALSRARAEAVAAALVQDGVAQARIIRSAVGTPPNSQPGVERRRVSVEVGGS